MHRDHNIHDGTYCLTGRLGQYEITKEVTVPRYNLTFEDLSSIVDLLRNESPMFYDEDQQLLATHHEPVGEEEGK